MYKYRNVTDIVLNPANPRTIKDANFKKLVQSLKQFPKMLEKRPLVCITQADGKLMVLGGSQRLRAAQENKMKQVPVAMADDWTEAERQEFILKDNISSGEWDIDLLKASWAVDEVQDWGLDIDLFSDRREKLTEAGVKLTEKFIVLPFSILDTKQGYWQDRKHHWKTLIQDKGESRKGTLSKGEVTIFKPCESTDGVSILDPVLAELTNNWFGLPGCKVFDPFAGDSVFGYVSSYLGHHFTGIELRQEQCDINNERVRKMTAKYICDDGRNVAQHIKPNSQDLLFSCPPYYDLEVYSDLPNDASNQGTYEEFLQILRTAFTDAIQCLKNNRFAVITVGDVRDKQGFYYRFVDHIKDIFCAAGMLLYNEMILVEPIGSLRLRVEKQMQFRKVGKCHQNVLVFYKGDPKQIKNVFPKIQIQQTDEGTDA